MREADKKRRGEQGVVVPPRLFRERSESRGGQPLHISAPLSRVHKDQSLDFRLQVPLVDLRSKPRKSKQREGGRITVDTLGPARPSFGHPRRSSAFRNERP